MKYTRVTFFIFLLLLCVSHTFFGAEKNIVRVGAFDDYPLLFQDTDGVFKGLFADLLNEIEKKEDIHFEFVLGTWQDGLDRIKKGDLDLLTDVGYSTERSLYMDYCKEPLMTFWGDLYVLKASEINGILKINDKKVGVLKGDIFGKNFQELAKKFSIDCEIIEYESYTLVFKAIADKKVDAGVAAGDFKATELKKYDIKSTGFVFSPIDVFFTTPKGKGADLRSILDKNLLKWKGQENSVFNQSRQKWLESSSRESVIPQWLINIVSVLIMISIIAFIFIVLLNRRVTKATVKIRQREKDLSESEMHFRSMIETIPVAIYVSKGIEQSSAYVNPTMQKLFGYSAEDIPDIKRWWPLAYPDEDYRKEISTEWTARVKRAIETQSSIEPMEVVVTCKDGSKKDILWYFISMGEKNYECGIDLTDRKQADDKIKSLLVEKELLLKEVHHRIKNNMTTIKGLLSLQICAEKNESALKSLKDAESRVQSLIMLYERLYCTDNYRELSIKEYLQPLAEEIISSFPMGRKVELKTEIEDYSMNVQLLSPLGIIANELLTNIMKYAFVGKERGLITISCAVKEKRVTIIIQDDGVGIPESVSFENSTGFGMQIISMLIHQIRGKIFIERGHGTKVVLEVDA